MGQSPSRPNVFLLTHLCSLGCDGQHTFAGHHHQNCPAYSMRDTARAIACRRCDMFARRALLIGRTSAPLTIDCRICVQYRCCLPIQTVTDVSSKQCPSSFAKRVLPG